MSEHSHGVSVPEEPPDSLRGRSTETPPQKSPPFTPAVLILRHSCGLLVQLHLSHFSTAGGATNTPFTDNEDNLETESSHLFRAGLVSTFWTLGATLSIVVRLCLRCHSTADPSALRYLMDFPCEENAHAHSEAALSTSLVLMDMWSSQTETCSLNHGSTCWYIRPHLLRFQFVSSFQWFDRFFCIIFSNKRTHIHLKQNKHILMTFPEFCKVLIAFRNVWFLLWAVVEAVQTSKFP